MELLIFPLAASLSWPNGAAIRDAPLKGIIGKLGGGGKTQDINVILVFWLYGSWEALDSSELIVFDVGVFLDTPATHSENFIFRYFFTFLPVGPPLKRRGVPGGGGVNNPK